MVDRLPEPITSRKRQNSIAEFLCTIHFWTIWLQNLNHVSLNRTAPCCRQNNWWLCRYNILGNTKLTLICHLEDFRREVAKWRTHWAITKRNDLPTTLCTTFDSVDPVLYPSMDTMLCVLLTMPVVRATDERSFSVLRRLKTYVRSTMYEELMHIHRDFEMDLYKAMEVFVSAQTRRANFGQFKKILVYQSHKKLCLILCYMKPWNGTRSLHFASGREKKSGGL